MAYLRILVVLVARLVLVSFELMVVVALQAEFADYPQTLVVLMVQLELASFESTVVVLMVVQYLAEVVLQVVARLVWVVPVVLTKN